MTDASERTGAVYLYVFLGSVDVSLLHWHNAILSIVITQAAPCSARAGGRITVRMSDQPLC